MTIKPSSVTLASEGDEELLFALICSSDDEWGTGGRDADKIRGVIWSAIHGTESPKPIFGVIAGTSVIEAAIGLFPTEPWNSRDLYLRAFFHFVHPLYRKSPHGADLREFGKWFGEVAGMPVLFELPRIDQPGLIEKARMFGRGTEWVGGMFLHRTPVVAVAA